MTTKVEVESDARKLRKALRFLPFRFVNIFFCLILTVYRIPINFCLSSISSLLENVCLTMNGTWKNNVTALRRGNLPTDDNSEDWIIRVHWVPSLLPGETSHRTDHRFYNTNRTRMPGHNINGVKYLPRNRYGKYSFMQVSYDTSINNFRCDIQTMRIVYDSSLSSDKSLITFVLNSSHEIDSWWYKCHKKSIHKTYC